MGSCTRWPLGGGLRPTKRRLRPTRCCRRDDIYTTRLRRSGSSWAIVYDDVVPQNVPDNLSGIQAMSNFYTSLVKQTRDEMREASLALVAGALLLLLSLLCCGRRAALGPCGCGTHTAPTAWAPTIDGHRLESKPKQCAALHAVRPLQSSQTCVHLQVAPGMLVGHMYARPQTGMNPLPIPVNQRIIFALFQVWVRHQ